MEFDGRSGGGDLINNKFRDVFFSNCQKMGRGFYFRLKVRHGDGGRGGGCSPSGCCSPRGCGRPRAAYRRRLTSAGQGGFPPCPGSSA